MISSQAASCRPGEPGARAPRTRYGWSTRATAPPSRAPHPAPRAGLGCPPRRPPRASARQERRLGCPAYPASTLAAPLPVMISTPGSLARDLGWGARSGQRLNRDRPVAATQGRSATSTASSCLDDEVGHQQCPAGRLQRHLPREPARRAGSRAGPASRPVPRRRSTTARLEVGARGCEPVGVGHHDPLAVVDQRQPDRGLADLDAGDQGGAGSERSRAAEKPSSRSLPARSPRPRCRPREVMTRTGLQPALTVATTARPGRSRPGAMLMTVSVPWPRHRSRRPAPESRWSRTATGRPATRPFPRAPCRPGSSR